MARRTYKKEYKQKLVKRMLTPENYSITKLSDETGISKSTLSTWKSKAKKGKVLRDTGRPINKLSEEEKFMVVVETYSLSEIELSKYCRKNGYFVEDVKKWKTNCISANSLKKIDVTKNKKLKKDLKNEKKKSKELSKELNRKEKALAEAAALLVLKKKLNAIFEDREED